MIHVPTPATECSEQKEVACVADQRKIPVAYEEVTLTEESAEILDRERQAASERPARNFRRMTLGTPAKRDS